MVEKGKRAPRSSAPFEIAPEIVPVLAAAAAVPEPPPATEPPIAEPVIAAPQPEDVPLRAATRPAPAGGAAAGGKKPVDLRRDTLAAFVESQAAIARGWEAIAAEMAGFARSGIAATAGTAKAMLGVKTLTDAMAVNAGFTRQSVDTLIGSSAKLSEIGVKMATDASRPILSRLGDGWKSGSRGV